MTLLIVLRTILACHKASPASVLCTFTTSDIDIKSLQHAALFPGSPLHTNKIKQKGGRREHGNQPSNRQLWLIIKCLLKDCYSEV